MTVAAASGVLPHDRLGLALFLSVAVHAIVVLGVVFGHDPPVDEKAPPTLEIILAQNASKQPIDEADYLAQISQEGGGNVEHKARPATPPPTPAGAPMAGAGDIPQLPRPAETSPQTPRENVLTAEHSPDAILQPLEETPNETQNPTPTSAELMMRSREIARIEAELSDTMQAYAKMPRRHFINARTKEYRYAAYQEAWRAKVERIGNLNYPEEARMKGVTGSLTLEVALNADGAINFVRLLRSSGSKLLDDAAIRIVKLAAPYAPFPQEIRKETDILHITRVWHFDVGENFEMNMGGGE